MQFKPSPKDLSLTLNVKTNADGSIDGKAKEGATSTDDTGNQVNVPESTGAGVPTDAEIEPGGWLDKGKTADKIHKWVHGLGKKEKGQYK